MSRKFLLLVVLLIFFPIFAIYAQDETSAEDETETEAEKDASKLTSDRPDFWLGVGGETAFYSAKGLSYGYNFALGYGSGSSIGLKGSFFSNGENLKVFEVDILLRFYTFGKNAYNGPFIQILGGASLINYEDVLKIPSSTGILNLGLGFGWRYVYFNRLYLEPAIRFGYPYFMDLGISAGIRF
ncbi:MAG: hypothetical protein FWF68_02775 [Spirochaetes bacterium]|nr:hypothetical protein [Spirochaetota bacterium]